MTPERERAPVSGTGARTNQPAGQRDEHKSTEHPPAVVDVNRLRDGVAQIGSVATVLAASALGDAAWDFAELEMRLAALRLLDAAVRNITVAVAT